MKRFIALFITFVFILSIIACDFTNEPTEGTLKVVNNSYLYDILVRSRSAADQDSDYGYSMIDLIHNVDMNTSREFELEPGNYDIQALSTSGYSYYAYKIEIVAGKTYTLTFPGDFSQ